jgi:hypothetical protein
MVAGAPAKWSVVKDSTAPSPPYVLALTQDNREGRPPLAIVKGVSFRDGEISVRCKPRPGTELRAAGLVWRYQNDNNYYLLQADAGINRIILCKVQNGKATVLPLKGAPPARVNGVKHTIPTDDWSLLKVVARGPVFSVYFDHRRVLQVEDHTFGGAGKVGLWTSAESLAYFDDFRVTSR